MQAANPRRGYILGLSAYIIWGLFPIYFKAIAAVPAIEIIIHRALWSALFGSIVLMFWKHPGWWRDLRNNPQRLAVLALSGTLIASNWIIYVWAVNNGRMLEASLGYYINPLVNVLLGMLLLGERLRRLQMLAVAFAAIGVAQQVWHVGSLPWVSLALPLTFAFYGLIRKQAPVAALPGLVVETWMLVPLALIWLALNPTAVSVQPEFWTTTQAIWLAAAGPVTLVPLVCFNAAQLVAWELHLTHRSAQVFQSTGCHGVAEGSALALAAQLGDGTATLLIERQKSAQATFALAISPAHSG
ncbi:EamA family transporter RarD [Pseudomonas syringae]|uniref:EamA family transporter RarD n=4 Tax=Pseudomonas syringae TaxID=317 RepID=UPI000E326CEA|nr:EamA family transporter RarD [Pseudomonas syringae]